MTMKPWTIYLFAFCLTLNSIHANADSTLPELPFSSGETLHYKLSYRGLLTSMVWVDIADASMTFLANQQALDTYKGHQFILSLSTENYTKAEMIQPVRYTYTATIDQSLQKTLLVEKIDQGKKQSHDFLWLDWQNKTTELFKKREKIPASSDFFDRDTKEVWEQDGELELPDFLSAFPVLENNRSYFIHKESGDKIDRSQVLEPLSLIYILRTLETDANVLESVEAVSSRVSKKQNEVKKIAIAISDDIRVYHIKTMGLQALEVAGRRYQALKYQIHSDEKTGKTFYIWINNNDNKIPLRISMDAPLGKLEIDLVKVILPESDQPKQLGTRTRQSSPTSI